MDPRAKFFKPRIKYFSKNAFRLNARCFKKTKNVLKRRKGPKSTANTALNCLEGFGICVEIKISTCVQ